MSVVVSTRAWSRELELRPSISGGVCSRLRLGTLDVVLERLAGELGEGDPAVAGEGIGLLAQLGGDAEADVG